MDIWQFLKDRKEVSHFPSRLREIKDPKPSLRSRTSPGSAFSSSNPSLESLTKAKQVTFVSKVLILSFLSDENPSLCFEGKHILLLCTCARARLLHRHGHCKSPSPLLYLQEQGPKSHQWEIVVVLLLCLLTNTPLSLKLNKHKQDRNWISWKYAMLASSKENCILCTF